MINLDIGGNKLTINIIFNAKHECRKNIADRHVHLSKCALTHLFLTSSRRKKAICDELTRTFVLRRRRLLVTCHRFDRHRAAVTSAFVFKESASCISRRSLQFVIFLDPLRDLTTSSMPYTTSRTYIHTPNIRMKFTYYMCMCIYSIYTY